MFLFSSLGSDESSQPNLLKERGFKVLLSTANCYIVYNDKLTFLKTVFEGYYITASRFSFYKLNNKIAGVTQEQYVQFCSVLYLFHYFRLG